MKDGSDAIADWPLLNALIDLLGQRAACFEALHRSHRPEAGPLSVCMHHELAGSVSLTRVDVTAGEVTLTYTPGPPGETPAGPAITLRRRATLPAGG